MPTFSPNAPVRKIVSHTLYAQRAIFAGEKWRRIGKMLRTFLVVRPNLMGYKPVGLVECLNTTG